jgi:hypothetical protein
LAALRDSGTEISGRLNPKWLTARLSRRSLGEGGNHALVAPTCLASRSLAKTARVGALRRRKFDEGGKEQKERKAVATLNSQPSTINPLATANYALVAP